MKAQERIVLIDVIRGFALLGILFINMKSYYSPAFIQSLYGITPNVKGVDKIIHIFYQTFIQMKFYPIFSLLFGLSFYLFLSKGFHVILYTRRMIILFLIGLIHLIFVWYGDILHVYALTSILLLLFYQVSSKSILYWGFALLAVYHVFISWNSYLPSFTLIEKNEYSNMLSTYLSIYKQGSYFEWVLYRINIEVIPVLLQFPFIFVPVLAWFLLGLYIGKEGIYERTPSNLIRVKLWWKISLIFAPVFLILSLLAHIFLPDTLYLLSSLSGIGLTILYITSIYIFFDHQFVKKVLYPLRYVGRMSLSNYLFQSIFLISFFRIFDLYNNISLSEGFIITILFFLIQLIVSKYWLAYFHQGPIEWIWRSFSIKKFSPFIKNTEK
ncbi:DUF418 domain-containing protein [Metabacillus halosaccharovorans]|uniref:DUF418 domain-containing protein n=1 Tax=Metabacillus halosaccharovorans TaxID=930124 RepID=UPI00203DF556|nr:DUF418 domain-containing protein [Metabacillus halosaccharovorans]MCM3440627.1 DUF418 domain-containing protein [Metabacillus halosaccharovorans]